MKKIIVTLISAMIGLVLISGCGGSDDADLPVREPDAAIDPNKPIPVPGVTEPFEFGESFDAGRGTITVSEPTAVSNPPDPKQWAAVTITVEVQDNAKKILDGAWEDSATANGRTVESSYYEETPVALPGQTVTWKVFLELPKTPSIEVVFGLAYDYSEPVYWAGTIASAEPTEPATYASARQVADAIDATDIKDSTDNPEMGTEVSAEWRGHEISVWMPKNESAVSKARAILESGDYEYAEGDGWFIWADSQKVAQAASDAATEALD
ncbi:MAG TPA: hypothetical protein VEX15_18345 [Nocardioidaceae bacterium]|nr:hypothetical protein [Nocardioidaceae bacterium]